MAGHGIRAERDSGRAGCISLDVGSAPIGVHGYQPKAEWNRQYDARLCHPLIVGGAGTVDMPDARPGGRQCRHCGSCARRHPRRGHARDRHRPPPRATARRQASTGSGPILAEWVLHS